MPSKRSNPRRHVLTAVSGGDMQKRNNRILAVATVLSLGIYLLTSQLKFGIGFPLDDAWIHQTYARNLAEWGQWAFWRGATSGGSTAPLWSALLALGYWLKIPFYFWTYALGGILLWSLAVLSEQFLREVTPSYRGKIPVAGIFIIGEWHLVWSAVSGMETLLYALIVTTVLVFLAQGKRNFLLFGALVGISLWVRPGGVTLLGPVLVVLFFEDNFSLKSNFSHLSRRRIFTNLFNLALGFGIFLALYFLFNLAVSGTPLPNTFYAKQAEYAVLREAPLIKRFLAQISLPLIGAGAFLLPSLLYFAWRARSKVSILVGGVWFLGYAAIYAEKLPVTYQHGRYLIPAMPIFFLWGLAGLIQLLAGARSKHWGKMGAFAWGSALVLIWGAFYLLGAKSYAEDVTFIESEMVATARWVNQNLPSNAIIAAHDIGALGYFDGRKIIDLAGLVSPEVIPFARDEGKLANYLNEQEVDYLIVFPSWYETLPEGLSIVYNDRSLFVRKIGGENMTIYQWTY